MSDLATERADAEREGASKTAALAEAEPTEDKQLAHASEEIHLPRPSILPLMLAIAITLIVLGLTTTFIISGLGLLITVGIIIRMSLDTARDISHLPPEAPH